jgi:hypothetical protein
MDEALKDLWNAAGAGAPFNSSLGIVAFWKDHWKELGSPVGGEHHATDGNVYQAFAHGIIKWTPTMGAIIV